MQRTGAMDLAKVQDFLDAVTSLDLPTPFREWYQVDVATILDGVAMEFHEVDPVSGDSLIFLSESAVFCSPRSGAIHHFPRTQLNCFVDDLRKSPIAPETEILFRADLFSSTATAESLCWVRECEKEHHIPDCQRSVARWMRWLNRV